MAHNIIKQPLKPAPPQPDEPTLSDILSEMGKCLERLEGRISHQRTHSIDTHLKGVLRGLGYKPNKKWKEGDYITLHAQIVAAYDEIDHKIPEANEWIVMAQSKTTLSNLKAEVADLANAAKEAPMKEAPLS